MLSNDGGATWREAGGGLPPGFAVAIADDDPDRMLYAARNRLYVSANGGVFWRSLPFELPGHRLGRLDRLNERLDVRVRAQAVHLQLRVQREARGQVAPVLEERA